MIAALFGSIATSGSTSVSGSIDGPAGRVSWLICSTLVRPDGWPEPLAVPANGTAPRPVRAWCGWSRATILAWNAAWASMAARWAGDRAGAGEPAGRSPLGAASARVDAPTTVTPTTAGISRPPPRKRTNNHSFAEFASYWAATPESPRSPEVRADRSNCGVRSDPEDTSRSPARAPDPRAPALFAVGGDHGDSGCAMD